MSYSFSDLQSPAQAVPVPAEEDFETFLDRYRQRLRHVFHGRTDIDRLGLRRGLPPFVMREIQSCAPLSVFIPSEYGGRGGHVHECQALLAASSYELLALSLTMGINGALFLQPLTKYGQEEAKEEIFGRFVHQQHLGGLMITEPDYGTDALSMQTSYVEQEEAYHVKGLKHWAGLTGWADYWLLTARQRGKDGQLARDIDFFVCDVNSPGQHIDVEEYFQNLGLYMIPYGRNRINVTVPKTHRLQPRSTGIKMMLDLLHRSRVQFPGMGMGFLQRMVDEALAHCRERFVGGASLLSYDQVQERIVRMQSFFTVCSAMCTYTSEHAGLERDLAKDNMPPNAIKSVITDFMQEASQSLLQLMGAKGYRLDHIAGRSTVDSRPFQIFEGSNDILYQQVTESVLKAMRRKKERNLQRYLSAQSSMARAADHVKELFNFEVDLKLPQRRLVELGQALSRVFCMELVIELGERGFRSDLVANSLSTLKQDVSAIVSRYRQGDVPQVVEDYSEQSSWLPYVASSCSS